MSVKKKSNGVQWSNCNKSNGVGGLAESATICEVVGCCVRRGMNPAQLLAQKV